MSLNTYGLVQCVEKPSVPVFGDQKGPLWNSTTSPLDVPKKIKKYVLAIGLNVW